MEGVKIVGRRVDTLVLNVSYADKLFQPIKQELDADLQEELNSLQGEARINESPVVTEWAFKGLKKRTEIDGKRVSAHQCRRYMATTQLAMGRSPLDVQRQLGHTTLAMTNYYASLTVQHIQKSHEKFSPKRAEKGSSDEAFGEGNWTE